VRCPTCTKHGLASGWHNTISRAGETRTTSDNRRCFNNVCQNQQVDRRNRDNMAKVTDKTPS
jgi:hypothetical protein